MYIYYTYVCIYNNYLITCKRKTKTFLYEKRKTCFTPNYFTFKVISGIQVPQRQALRNCYLACNYKVAL